MKTQIENQEIQIELYESPMKDRNERKFGYRATPQCICCYKPLKENEKFRVHMSTDWMAMHNSIVTEIDAEINGLQSQGYFEIGNSCAKKMPAKYLHKIK